MSGEESAAMDGLPAEPSPEEPVEAASSQTLHDGGSSAAPETAVEADSDKAATEAATETAGAAEAEVAAASSEEDSADGSHEHQQQLDSSSAQVAEPDGVSSSEAEAGAADAAEAEAEEDAQQHMPAVETEAELEPVTSNAAGTTAGAAAALLQQANNKEQPAEQQARQSTHSQASRPASSSHAAASPEPKPAAAVAAAAPAPAKQHAVEEEAEPAAHIPTSKPHKETAVERLTTPTAMRMLKTLQQTQGDKTDWHIASGVVYKSKKLAPDEMAAMVDRLCVAKHKDDDMPPKLHAVKLVYDDNGREVYEPVKEVTKDENISYMAELYSRCQETRAKTQQQLAEKYLQPLVVPKAKSPAKSPAKADKAPTAETA